MKPRRLTIVQVSTSTGPAEEAIRRRQPSRLKVTLLSETQDEGVREDNPARAVDAFVEELDLVDLMFEQAEPGDTGQPAYHPRRSALWIYLRAASVT